MKYFSEKLNKLFDDEAALVKAEKELAEAETKKAEASLQKKADAEKVEEAFKVRNEARREFNAKLLELRKEYNATVTAAKEHYEKAAAEITEIKDQAEKLYSDALAEFTKKHKNYHLTLKDGDNVTTLSRAGEPVFQLPRYDLDLFFSSLLDTWKF